MSDLLLEEPLVSVIIPVYNAAKYLQETLDCVCGQTLRQIEIICVDDGSTDDSLAILQEYAAKDGRVRIIQQKNQYAGVARNNGMAQAKGKYLSFLDADDLFEPTMLEEMHLRAETQEADIVICQADGFYEETGDKYAMHSILNESLLQNVNSALFCPRRDIPEHIFLFTNPCPWSKLFRADFLQKHHLRWQATPYCNDVFFVCSALFHAERVSALFRNLIHYRNRLQSISHNKSRDIAVQFEVFADLKHVLEASQASPVLLTAFNRFFIFHTCGFLTTISAEKKEEVYREYPKRFDKQYFHILTEEDAELDSQTAFFNAVFQPKCTFIIESEGRDTEDLKTAQDIAGLTWAGWELIIHRSEGRTDFSPELNELYRCNPRIRISYGTPLKPRSAYCVSIPPGHVLSHRAAKHITADLMCGRISTKRLYHRDWIRFIPFLRRNASLLLLSVYGKNIVRIEWTTERLFVNLFGKRLCSIVLSGD